MSKKSLVRRNEKRRVMASQKFQKRNNLKEVLKNLSLSVEERFVAQAKLASMPKNSSFCRVRHRCRITGRARGNLRRFGMSSLNVRLAALSGILPGVTKSSW